MSNKRAESLLPAEVSDQLCIRPLGAGQEVGRSCIMLEFKGKKIMLDCGIHPGLSGMDALPFVDLIEADEVDLLLISHNISTEQMLYTESDLESSMDRIETINFHEEKDVQGVKFWAYNAGHVLGAAMFMIEIAGVKVLYTGDFSRQEDRHLMAAEIPTVHPDVLITGIDHFEDIGPCVIMASPGMMQSGLSRELFELWCTDTKNGVIIAGNHPVEEKTQTDLLRKAFNEDDDSDGDEIFEVEQKVEEEKKEDIVKDYLKGKVDHINAEAEQDLDALKTLWSDPKLNDGEAFLRDYILDRRYLDDDEKANSEEKLRDDEGLEEDNNTIEEQGKFERAYNFRFEEPDQEYLKRYPRTMNHIRPKDNRRATKRTEVKQRKAEEKQKKLEEISRLKSLKLKEITEKIAKLKEITGNEDMAFEEEDIIGDFDPDEHDRKMQQLFNDEYYGEQDTEKPVFPDLDEELELENWDNYEEEMNASESRQHRSPDGDDGPHCEDGDFNMDADYDPGKPKTSLLEEIQEMLGKKKRHRKRKNKLVQILASEKPKFDPLTADRTYSEYMEEYYKMDCEDIIGGDLPCRFKYRDVVPNSYGLTIEEILLADDRELNQWVPLKKTVKLRPDFKEKGDVKTYQKRAEDVNLKKKLLPSLFREEIDEENSPNAPKKKKNKKKKKSKTETEVSNTEDVTLQKLNIDEDIAKFYENNEAASSPNEATSSPANEEMNGSDTSKKKKRKKNKTKNEILMVSNEKETTNCDTLQINDHNNDDSAHEESANAENTTKTSKKNKKHITLSSGPSKGDFTKHLQPNSELLTSNKRKLKELEESVLPTKKVKHNKKKHQVGSLLEQKSNNLGKLKKQKDKTNPMSNISDERLKAYGLNPKKYRSFLKYKKQ